MNEYLNIIIKLSPVKYEIKMCAHSKKKKQKKTNTFNITLKNT